MSLIFASTTQIITQRLSSSWPWYVVRGAGFTAAALLILLMISGIGMVTGLTYKFLEPIKAWAVHKALGIALLVAIAVHIGFLLIDHFVPFSIWQLFIPFLSRYTNGTKLLGLPLGVLGVTLGILAMYGVIIVVLSSLGWIDTKKKAWRWLHYLSYIVMFFVFLHALYNGTDLKYGTFRTIWVLIGLVLVVATVSRLLRSGTLKPRNNDPDDDDE